MATYAEYPPRDSNVTAATSVLPSGVRLPPYLPPFFRQSTSTLSPGHAAILEMHANSQMNAITYVLIVLGLYLLAMTVVVIKYVRGAHDEARLTRMFRDLMQRDRFFRASGRRSSLPKPPDLPLSPVPGIQATVSSPTSTSPEDDKTVDESKV